MAEAPRSSANNAEQDLKNLDLWNKWNPNSKLNEISDFIKQSDNSKIKQLMEYIVNQDYRWLQKAVWYKGTLDGKLWTKSLESVKKYAEIQAVKDEEKRETNDYVDNLKKELQQQKQEVEEYSITPTVDLWYYQVRNNEWKIKDMWKWEIIPQWDISVEINNKTQSITFEWIGLVDGAWAMVKIPDIKNFYWIRTKEWIDIYSDFWGWEELPRLKIRNDWIVEWRSNPIDKTFDIKLDSSELTIFDTLKHQLINKFKEKEYPKTSDGYRIEWKFLVNKGNAHFPWLKLFNSQTQNREGIPSITGMYMKKDSENNLTIYSSGEDNPKMILKPNGIVKWVTWNSWDNLNYWAKGDTSLWVQAYDILNSNYSKYTSKRESPKYNPKYTAYITWKSFSNSVVADGGWNNPNTFKNGNRSEVTADSRWNAPVKKVKNEDYSDIGMHKEIDKNGNTIWVSDRIRPS